MERRKFFVYILMNCRNTVIYIGVTGNLERRLTEHKNKVFAGFTKKYNVDKLVYCEEHQYIYNALSREKQLKRWSRKKKLNLIRSINPDLEEFFPE